MRNQAVLCVAVLVASLAVGAFATPAAAQGAVTIDAPDEVEADGEFDFTVTMEDSGVGEVVLDPGNFGAELSVVDDDGDGIGAQTDTNVEFIDIDGETSTYTLNVDVTDGSGGDTGTITAATGGNIGGSEVDDTATATFTIESSGGTADDGGGDGDEDGGGTTDGGTEDGDDGEDGGDSDGTTDGDGGENAQDGSQDGQDTDGTQTQDPGGDGQASDGTTDEDGGGQDTDGTEDGGGQSTDGTEDGEGQDSDGTDDGGAGDDGPEEGLPGFTPTTGLMVAALLAFVLLALRYRG